MIFINVKYGDVLRLGQQGENEAITFKFFVKGWIESYGAGEFAVLNKRTEDPDAYPCAVTNDDDYVYWTITSAETQYKGNGECQLVYTVDGTVVKTAVFRTVVDKSLGSAEEPPEPWKGWVDEIYAKMNEYRLSNLRMQKLRDYLYYTEFADWDYAKGNEYYRRHRADPGACSSVRNGSFYGRNFDWFYDNAATFVVRSLGTKGRHSSISVSGGTSLLTEEIAAKGEWTDDFEYIPFLSVDGINDAHVACNTNIVPAGDKGRTTGTNPDAEESMCSVMIVRYVLDYADSAADAVEKIRTVNWWAPGDESPFGAIEVHCMIADKDSTYVVEFADNEIRVFSDAEDEYPDIPNGMPVMTNFYYDGWDGDIVTGFDRGGIEPEETTLTAHAEGLERYQILCDGYDMAGTMTGMADLMESVKFTNSYDRSGNIWYSDFCGEYAEPYGDLTIYMSAEEYQPILDYTEELYLNRSRDTAKTWQTVHMSVIDIDNGTIAVYAQEDYSRNFGFSSQQLGTKIEGEIRSDDVLHDFGITYPNGTIGHSVNGIAEEFHEYVDTPKTAGEILYDAAEEYEDGTVGDELHLLAECVAENTEDISALDDYVRITAEEYTVSEWERMVDETVEPYIYKAEVTASYLIGEDTQVELINNSAVLFAKYGFAIASAEGQTLTVYALDAPYDPVTLRVEYTR